MVAKKKATSSSQSSSSHPVALTQAQQNLVDETKSVGRVPKRKKGSSPDDQRENKLVCTHDQAVDLINANFVMSGKTINLCLKNIHGDNVSRLSIESTALCAHVAAHAAATKKGCIAMLMAGQMYLKLDCSLEQQGVTEDADITCVFTNVTSAQYNKVIHAFEQHPGQEPQGEDFAIWHSLTSLALTHVFNQSLDNVRLPRTLQTLTFGHYFNQSLDNVSLPSALQTLTFGDYQVASRTRCR